MGALEAARAVDSGNSSLQQQFEKAEKSRKMGLSPLERIKEQGDDKYKNGMFEDAIALYTKCIDQARSSNDNGPTVVKALSNRAACHKQLSNFDGTIEDCTNVLEHKPDDVKALVRRAQSLEAVERYKSAMQDVRQVLAYGPEVCGKASYDLANGMQHRLTRLIQQLKM